MLQFGDKVAEGSKNLVYIPTSEMTIGRLPKVLTKIPNWRFDRRVASQCAWSASGRPPKATIMAPIFTRRLEWP